MDPNSYFVHQQYFVVFIGSLCVYNDFVVALPPLWKRVEIESGQTLVHGTWRGWFLKSKKKPFIPLVITPAISIMIRLHLFVERSREITEMHIRFPSIPLHPIICLPKKRKSTKMREREGRYFISWTDNEGCNERKASREERAKWTPCQEKHSQCN